MDQGFNRLDKIVQRLLGPAGCPWDREQTLRSLRRHTIEEAYELCEAVEAGDNAATVDELGDLLFHIFFYVALGNTQKLFAMSAVTSAICDKLERRHPHVFGDEEATSRATVAQRWEQIKRVERRAGGSTVNSALDGVSRALPALVRARKLTERAAGVGFDWPDLAGPLDKLHEELEELEGEIHDYPGDAPESVQRRREAELGDLLLAAVNLSRFLGLDPEVALTGANQRFEKRFRHVEGQLAAQGKRPQESSLEEMDALWNQAKKTG